MDLQTASQIQETFRFLSDAHLKCMHAHAGKCMLLRLAEICVNQCMHSVNFDWLYRSRRGWPRSGTWLAGLDWPSVVTDLAQAIPGRFRQ